MILLVTNKRDITGDFIVLELRKRGLPFHRLNTEDLPSGAIRFRPGAERDWEIESGGETLALRDVRAAYYRRPGAPEPRVTDDAATQD